MLETSRWVAQTLRGKRKISKLDYFEKVKSKPMPKGTYNWLKFANPDMAWMCFREDVAKSFFHWKFCGNPYIEYSKYFTICNVFYKKRQNLEKLRLVKAELRHIDKLQNIIGKSDHVFAHVMKTVIQQKDYHGKAIPQKLKYNVADVHNHNLKSCQIRISNCTYRGIQLIPSRKIRIDVPKQGLEGMRYMYIVTDTMVADVKLTVHLGMKISKMRWNNAVVAFSLSKYELHGDGYIGMKVNTNHRRRALTRANSWWVPRYLNKPLQKRAEFTEGDFARPLPERHYIEETQYVECERIPDFVKMIQALETHPIITVVDGDSSWRVVADGKERFHLVQELRDAKAEELQRKTQQERDEPVEEVESIEMKYPSEGIIFSEEVALQKKQQRASITEWSNWMTTNIQSPKEGNKLSGTDIKIMVENYRQKPR